MKKITIKDIAKEANVSVATVSRVVNNKAKGVGEATRKKIMDLVDRYQYQPSAVARGLVTKKTNIIGLIIPDITNPFYPKMAKGVEDAANEYGYNIILCDGNNSAEKETHYLRILNEHYVSGVIYNNFHKMSESTLELIRNSHLPLVFIDNYVDIDGSSCLTLDNKKAMYELVEHFIQMGHQKIAFVTGYLDSYSAEERYKGYIQALEDYMIPVDENLIILGNCVAESGYKAAEKLLSMKNKVTGIICHNDFTAIGVIQKLEESGACVPDDFSVAGFDNIDFSNIITPKLTTVHYPVYEMGRKAAQSLIQIIEEGKPAENEEKIKLFEHKLVLRDSVRKIR